MKVIRYFWTYSNIMFETGSMLFSAITVKVMLTRLNHHSVNRRTLLLHVFTVLGLIGLTHATRRIKNINVQTVRRVTTEQRG